MAVAATSTDLRESLIAQRIARVQPLPVDVCQWVAHQSPSAPQARVALLGGLVERISAANPQPFPYLSICTLASVLPYYQASTIEEQGQVLPRTLDTLCGLLSISHLRVVIEEEWNVLTEAAQQQAWLPTYFASEYLTIDFPLWCRELVDRSVALLGENGVGKATELECEDVATDWEKSFRDAEKLLFAKDESFSQEFCKDLGTNQRSALLALIERACSAMSSENRFELYREKASNERPVINVEVKPVASSALADSLRGAGAALPKLAAAATHPAIEEYYPAFNDLDLHACLDSVLIEARNSEVPVNLVIIRELKGIELAADQKANSLEIQNSPARVWLEKVCNELSETHEDSEFSKLLSIRSGELIYVQGGGDRLKLMPWIRNVLDSGAPLLSSEMVSLDDEGQVPNGLIAGLASVGRPNKSFRSATLLQASLRCLEAAQRQGAGAIKSIEVF